MTRKEIREKRDRVRRSVVAFYVMGSVQALLGGVDAAPVWVGVMGWVFIVLAYNQDAVADRLTRELEGAAADDVRR